MFVIKRKNAERKRLKLILPVLFFVMSIMVLVFSYATVISAESTSEKPDIEVFFEEYCESLDSSPFLDYYISNADFTGLFDNSIVYDNYRKNYEILKSYDKTELTHEQSIAYDVLDWYLKNELEGEKFFHHKYFADQLNERPYQFPVYKFYFVQVTDRESAKLYLTGLAKFDDIFDELMREFKLREEKGFIPPKYVIDKTIENIKDFIRVELSDRPEPNLLYMFFNDRVSGVPDLSEAEKEGLRKGAKILIGKNIYNHYQDLIAYLEELKSKAYVEAGVWQLPDGDEYYAYLLRKWTTTDLTPEEIHNIGLKEVERIQSEMRVLLDELGYQGVGIAEAFEKLNEKNKLTDPDEILARAQEILDNTAERLPEMFATIPDIKITPKMRKSRFSAYFSIGMEGNPIFVLSSSMPQYVHEMQSTAFHETNPGHNFQAAMRKEIQYYPQFRYRTQFSVYKEGWAVYSERLAKEFGLYSDKESEIGYLKWQLIRAARLVIDTGIHYKRWTRDQAMDYLYNTTGIAGIQNEEEIDRYIVWPGQACTYTIGQLKIIELREKAHKELGEQFDIKDFHDVVLRCGDVPLSILEDEVNRYIQSKK